MAEKHIDDFDPSSSYSSFKTFKEREALIEKKELPEFGIVEKIFNYTLFLSGVCASIICLICLLYYTFNNSVSISKYYTTANAGYGPIGIGVIILFFVAFAAYCISMLVYHLKDIEKKDHEKAKKRSAILSYILLALIFTVFFVIWLRPRVVGIVTWGGLGYFFMVVVWLLCALGIYLNCFYKGKKAANIYNDAIILTIFWLPVILYHCLRLSTLNIVPAAFLIIFTPITMDVAYLFKRAGKDTPFMHSLWHLFSIGAVTMFMTAILNYSYFAQANVFFG